LPKRWDEAIPLGQMEIGCIGVAKNDKLRFLLTGADCGMKDWQSIFKFNSNGGSRLQNQYDTVQKLGDAPYEAYPYPTKLCRCAIEFHYCIFGKSVSFPLDVRALKQSGRAGTACLCQC